MRICRRMSTAASEDAKFIPTRHQLAFDRRSMHCYELDACYRRSMHWSASMASHPSLRNENTVIHRATRLERNTVVQNRFATRSRNNRPLNNFIKRLFYIFFLMSGESIIKKGRRKMLFDTFCSSRNNPMLAITKRVERVDSAVFLAAGRGEVVWKNPPRMPSQSHFSHR